MRVGQGRGQWMARKAQPPLGQSKSCLSLEVAPAQTWPRALCWQVAQGGSPVGAPWVGLCKRMATWPGPHKR